MNQIIKVWKGSLDKTLAHFAMFKIPHLPESLFSSTVCLPESLEWHRQLASHLLQGKIDPSPPPQKHLRSKSPTFLVTSQGSGAQASWNSKYVPCDVSKVLGLSKRGDVRENCACEIRNNAKGKVRAWCWRSESRKTTDNDWDDHCLPKNQLPISPELHFHLDTGISHACPDPPRCVVCKI